MKTLNLLASSRLPDEGQWTNRMSIKSGSSSTIHVVSQHSDQKYWACSCKGWTTRPAVRDCRHLKEIGLPGGMKPYEVRIVWTGAVEAEEIVVQGAPPKAQPRYGNDAGITSLGRRKIDA